MPQEENKHMVTWFLAARMSRRIELMCSHILFCSQWIALRLPLPSGSSCLASMETRTCGGSFTSSVKRVQQALKACMPKADHAALESSNNVVEIAAVLTGHWAPCRSERLLAEACCYSRSSAHNGGHKQNNKSTCHWICTGK